MAARNPLAKITRIDSDARIHGFGDIWRLRKSTPKGHWLSQVYDPASKMFVSHLEFNTEAQRADFVYEPGFFRVDCVLERSRKHHLSIAHLPKQDQADVVFKVNWIREFYKLYRDGTVDRSTKGFDLAVELIAANFGLAKPRINWNVDDPNPPPKKRGCRNNVNAIPSGSSLRRWIERLEECDWDLTELRDGRHNSGNTKGWFSDETYDLLDKFAHKFASAKRPTRWEIYGRFEIAFRWQNRRFKREGREPDRKPSFSRFCLEVAKLDRFEVDLARLGRDKAHRKWKILGIGQDVTNALERVEMDFYKVDLHVVFADTKVWQSLSPRLREKIERGSWYLCVALDVATRCVLAMKLTQREDARVALETLRMIYHDKSSIGRAAGALTLWDQHGPPWELATDQGAAFVDAFFQSRALSLLMDVFNPPAAQPQLRAFIERFFRTVKENLLSRFEGNTGGSVAALGDYPAQLRAVLTVDQFADLLVRWCVDIYHNRRHAGLGGETPRDAWLRLTKLLPPRPAPDRERVRISFGIDLTRTTRRTGVRVLGLDYSSEQFQARCRKQGDAEVEVKLDPYNLGAVSVRFDPGSTDWMTVPCRTRFMEGRRLRDWLSASEDLARRFDDVAQMRWPIVLAAIEAIERTHKDAVGIAQIGDEQYDSDAIAFHERKLRLGFAVPPTDDGIEPGSTPGGAAASVARTGTLPTSFALPGSRSFAAGAPRATSRVHRPEPHSPIRATPAAEAPVSDRAAAPPVQPCGPNDQTPGEDAVPQPARRSDATEPARPRRRQSTWKLEK
ncbi:hypothetical protein VQ02_26240 [Methylobacterium variabile]|jgi:putative transposase|uniref:Integrase catalytic domain-containing protein n=1 Tax=Methylobacterium variabile TaxID=298794 RepID=A0A0J6SC75_9HYPH|nr:Mu transposase C-terminal domain-containing protein [Methylobacterium variabile]KMO31327.1 hypothetical protein VQ02_26240 [Methylobacterium variabile]